MDLLNKETQKKLERYKFWKLSEKVIFESLSDIYRWPFCYTSGQPTIEVIGIDRRFLFTGDGYVNEKVVKNYYDRGYTLIISRIQFLTEELRKYFHIVQKDNPNILISMNIYMSKGKKEVSFPLHNHDYDVIVKNIKGSSTWIKGNEKVILKNQNILYLPKYTNHQVIEIQKPKLSITCNFENSTYMLKK